MKTEKWVYFMVIKYENNWIPTKTLEEMSKTDYDVLIVGSVQEGEPLYRAL